MPRPSVLIFLVLVFGLALVAVNCGGKKKDKAFYIQGTDTSTSTDTGTSTGTGTVPPGSLVWAKRAGGIEGDWGYGISALPDGSTIVTGRYRSTATFGPGDGNETDLTSVGLEDIFIARYNPDGTLNWARSAGGLMDDYGFAVSALSDCSVLVTGWISGNATFGVGEGNETDLTPVGSKDIFIAKYNPDGTLAWAESAGGADDDRGFGISALFDGSALVAGWFGGIATFGAGDGNETDLTTAGSVDIFIAKYNPDGTLAWAKSAGGINDDRSYGVSALPDGSALVSGWFGGTVTFGNASAGGNETDLTTAGNRDIFIAKYNTDGTLAWAESAGGIGQDYCWGISALSDGSGIVTGAFYDNDTTFGAGEGNETILPIIGGSDIFIAKYNPDGTLAWAKSAGDTGGDSSSGVSALLDGSALITGYFDCMATFGAGDANETDLVTAGFYDLFVAKYNPDGSLAWAKSAGCSGDNDYGRSVCALSDGSAIATGHFQDTAVFGAGEANETPLPSSGGGDLFIAKYNP